MPTSQAAIQTSRAAGVSLGTNAVLSALKLAVGHLTGSISVLADGANSAGDIITSLIAWSAVRQANRPPDDEHSFGHGKFESLSAALESLVIIGAAIAIGYGALRRLLTSAPGEIEHGLALAVMGVSAATNLGVSLYLSRTAQRHDSLALRAEASHRQVDVWTSAGVLAGLLLITLTGWEALDPLLAVVVSAVILWQGAQVGKEAVQQLLDQALPADEMTVIRGLLDEHDDLFVDYHRLRARKAGRERQIDLHMVTCPQVTVEQAHDVCDHLEKDIQTRLSHTRVVIHVEPCKQEECTNRTASVRDPKACVLRASGAATPASHATTPQR
jgi:cation diffusion facilitator family transporter